MNILLTGASRGIGAATLEALTSSGHKSPAIPQAAATA